MIRFLTFIPLLISAGAGLLAWWWLHGFPVAPASTLLLPVVEAEVVALDLRERRPKGNYRHYDLEIEVAFERDGQRTRARVLGYERLRSLPEAADIIADQVEAGRMQVRVPADTDGVVYRPDPPLYELVVGLALALVSLAMLPVGLVVARTGGRA